MRLVLSSSGLNERDISHRPLRQFGSLHRGFLLVPPDSGADPAEKQREAHSNTGNSGCSPQFCYVTHGCSSAAGRGVCSYPPSSYLWEGFESLVTNPRLLLWSSSPLTAASPQQRHTGRGFLVSLLLTQIKRRFLKLWSILSSHSFNKGPPNHRTLLLSHFFQMSF